MLDTMAQYAAQAVSPPKTNQLDYEENLYADCNKIERFFGRLKDALGATRN